MTSSTNNEKYLPEPAWLNITQFLIPKKTPLPLFPHPTAWALTESGLNFHGGPDGNRGFYHDWERWDKNGHPDKDIFNKFLWNLPYNEQESEFGDDIGFGGPENDRVLHDHVQFLMEMAEDAGWSILD